MMKLIQAQKAAKTNIFPDYWTLLYGRRLSDIMIKTLTGTLPLTFRTSETALRSWTIYGNDFQHEESKSTCLPLSFYTDEDKLRNWTIYGNNTQYNYSAESTLPLTFTSHTAGAASDWSISGNDSIGKNKLPSAAAETKTVGNLSVTSDGNGGYTINKTGVLAEETIVTFDIPELTIPVSQGQGGDGILALFNTKMPTGFQILFYYNGTRLTYISLSTAANRVLTNYSNSLGGQKIDQIAVRMAATESTDIETGVLLPMLTTDNITPSTFEPYQIGVGQRTKNLLEITPPSSTSSGVSYIVNKNDGTIIANGTAQGNSTFQWNYELAAGNYVLSGCLSQGSNSTFGLNVSLLDWSRSWWDCGSGVVINLLETTTVRVRVVIYNGITADNLVFKPMIRLADTSADFIPFGYEIPLTVNSTTQDIYIGSAPLTAGQSISKTSTGVDIAAIAGSNTISTDLYNKPEMAIEGVDYVGVGEYVNGQWQIPLTVSDGTNTTTVNVPINAPLTASDTATKTSTGVDIATTDGTNTISTTLENKPQMLVYYGYKGVGEHSGDTWVLYFNTSTNGNQQLTKITMDKPLRAGETLTSEQAGVTIPTYADAENTLSLYPNAAGYGNPEMSITYKGG